MQWSTAVIQRSFFPLHGPHVDPVGGGEFAETANPLSAGFQWRMRQFKMYLMLASTYIFLFLPPVVVENSRYLTVRVH